MEQSEKTNAVGLTPLRRNKKSKLPMFGVKAKVFVAAMLAYAIVNWLIFYVYLNIDSILLAFKVWDEESASQVFLPANRLFENFGNFYKELFSASGTGKYFLRGAVYHLSSILIAYPISLIFSYLIYKKLFLHNVFKIVLYLPSILSTMVVAILFKYGIENLLPQIVPGLSKYGNLLQNETTATPILIAYSLFFAMPGSLIIQTSTMSTIPQELVEYGKLEGITMAREFRSVILPLVYPLIMVQCLGIFVGFFTAQGPLYAVYAGSAPEHTYTFGYYMFTRIVGNKNAEFYYGYTAAANLAIGLMSVPIVYATKWLLERFDPEAEF